MPEALIIKPPALKRVLKLSIVDRLKTRFDLEDLPSIQALTLAPSIQIITSVDDLLLEVVESNNAKDISGSVFVAYYTVPAGKRAFVRHIVTPTTTANHQLLIQSKAGNQYVVANATTTGAVFLSADIGRLPLPESWAVGLLGTGNVGDNSRTMRLIMEEEDAF